MAYEPFVREEKTKEGEVDQDIKGIGQLVGE